MARKRPTQFPTKANIYGASEISVTASLLKTRSSPALTVALVFMVYRSC